jgi:hypothetical protein
MITRCTGKEKRPGSGGQVFCGAGIARVRFRDRCLANGLTFDQFALDLDLRRCFGGMIDEKLVEGPSAHLIMGKLRCRQGWQQVFGDVALFEQIAAPQLVERVDWSKDESFFIRRAIGWVLRELASCRPEGLVDFVQRHRERMSGLTYCEALRKLPPEWAARLCTVLPSGSSSWHDGHRWTAASTREQQWLGQRQLRH